MSRLSGTLNAIHAETLTISRAQREQPWEVPYGDEIMRRCSGFRDVPMANHAVLHAMKSLGKIAAELEEFDHVNNGGRTLSDAQIDRVADMAADLVTVALRLGNVLRFDVASTLIRRVREKNGRGYEP